eukprot:3090041-Rhodomonas_salina.1
MLPEPESFYVRLPVSGGCPEIHSDGDGGDDDGVEDDDVVDDNDDNNTTADRALNMVVVVVIMSKMMLMVMMMMILVTTRIMRITPTAVHTLSTSPHLLAKTPALSLALVFAMLRARSAVGADRGCDTLAQTASNSLLPSLAALGECIDWATATSHRTPQ